jgi:hypothetical protein
MSTCTGLAALDHANTKFNAGYAESGKAAGSCTQHEILLRNGVGALQNGERYVCFAFVKVRDFSINVSPLLQMCSHFYNSVTALTEYH